MWGSGFTWKNRDMCLMRIFILVTAGSMDLDKALRAALDKNIDGDFYYCNDPTRIPPDELIRLREHAQAIIEAKGNLKRSKQLALPMVEENPGRMPAGL